MTVKPSLDTGEACTLTLISTSRIQSSLDGIKGYMTVTKAYIHTGVRRLRYALERDGLRQINFDKDTKRVKGCLPKHTSGDARMLRFATALQQNLSLEG